MRLKTYLMLSCLTVMAGVLDVSAMPLQPPNCSGAERWPTRMAYTQLKNAGILNPENVDFSKTRTVRLASERVGDDLYRQIHRVTFTQNDGTEVEVIISNVASSEECSMSGVEVFVVSKHFTTK